MSNKPTTTPKSYPENWLERQHQRLARAERLYGKDSLSAKMLRDMLERSDTANPTPGEQAEIHMPFRRIRRPL